MSVSVPVCVYFPSQPWFRDAQNTQNMQNMCSVVLCLLQDQEGHTREMLLSKVNEKEQLVSHVVEPPLLIAENAKEKCVLWPVMKLSRGLGHLLSFNPTVAVSILIWVAVASFVSSVVIRSPVDNAIS